MTSEGQGAQRTFMGERLAEVAFPLGGIGTGTVSLGGRGNLQDWEIFNRPAKGRSLPYSFFALWARPEGGPAVARVLERKLLPPFVREHGLPAAQAAGLPRLDEVRFSGEYPFAYLEFEDAALPLRVSLEAFNPMAPLDADVSGLPVAIFRWRLRNPGPRPVQATIALSLCNAVGYDGVAPLGTQPRHPGFGGNLNAWREEGTVRGLAMSARRPAPDALAGDTAPDAGAGAGSLAIATTWPDVTYLERWERAGWFDSLQSFWDDFRQDGILPGVSAPDPSPEGLTDVGTVGLRVTLPAGGEATLPFVLAWHFPELTNYWNRPGRGLASSSRVPGARLGNYDTTRHADAWAVAQEVAGALDGLRARTLAFKGALFDSTLPAEVLDAVSSQMSIIRTTTCLRTEDGAFHAFEGCDD
ncbi:MAG TPA: GH116 family glycosyl-hydrolase, partial [Chloroflexota bacterium]|nr:GH116 family glycosyl-hydrolase [Chloroflexota bacterium]